MKHLFNKYILLIVAILIAAIAMASVWPYNVATVRNIAINTKVVKIGDSVSYSVKSCKFLDITPDVDRYFISEHVKLRVITPIQRINPVGCRTLETLVEVPKDIPTGIYHIHVVARFKVNIVRAITIEYDTPKFEIIG